MIRSAKKVVTGSQNTVGDQEVSTEYCLLTFFVNAATSSSFSSVFHDEKKEIGPNFSVGPSCLLYPSVKWAPKRQMITAGRRNLAGDFGFDSAGGTFLGMLCVLLHHPPSTLSPAAHYCQLRDQKTWLQETLPRDSSNAGMGRKRTKVCICKMTMSAKTATMVS